MTRPYHHGDLRPALLRAAVDVITERGAAGTSLREVARRAEVTHTAASYHFGDKAGLLTAVAVEGYRLLGDALGASHEAQGSFLEVGIAYVRFAAGHPAHLEVMFQPALYDAGDPALAAARARTASMLYGTTDADDDQLASGLAAWSIVHGLVTLWRNGNVPRALGNDPEQIARRVLVHLRPGRREVS